MRLAHDPQADAIYVYLREASAGSVAFTEPLDDARNIDYGADQKPIGIEFLYVSDGVRVVDLPERAAVAQLLAEQGFTILPEPAKIS